MYHYNARGIRRIERGLHMAARTFGQYVRESRLRAGYGLRRFAMTSGFKPSNLSNIEQGKLAPPQDPDRLAQIADALGLLVASQERQRLFDLAAKARNLALPADVEGYVRRHKAIPVILRTAQARKLTDRQFRDLTDYINRSF